MIIVHDIFVCKPGQASKMAKLFKEVMTGDKNFVQVMTDMTGQYNRVIMVSQYDSLTTYEKSWEEMMKDEKRMAQWKEKMADYHEMFMTGSREIYRVV